MNDEFTILWQQNYTINSFKILCKKKRAFKTYFIIKHNNFDVFGSSKLLYKVGSFFLFGILSVFKCWKNQIFSADAAKKFQLPSPFISQSDEINITFLPFTIQ